MKTIQAVDLTDKQWECIAKFEDALKQNTYTEKWSGQKKDPIELKNDILAGLNLSENGFSNFYYIFEGTNVKAFIEAFERRGNLYIVFDHSDIIITENDLNKMYAEINSIMKERNKHEAFFFTFYERHYAPVLKSGAEVHEELLDSILLKEDIDFPNLQKIINDNKTAHSFDLKLFHEISEEIYDRFVKYMNEAIIDANCYNSKKDDVKEYTMKDLLERVRDIKDDKCPYYMLMLFDGNNIVAHCSVFIDFDSKSSSHWIDHKGAGYTATGRNYRGKNLAKYLKAKMYLKIQEDYPGFGYVITDTFPWNKHMYRINEEFGFKPYQKGYTFRFTGEFLENFLK